MQSFMVQRPRSLPPKTSSSFLFTDSIMLNTSSNLGASQISSIISPNNYIVRRPVTPNKMIVPYRNIIPPQIYNFLPVNAPMAPPKPNKTYDIILRKGQDFYNFDEDIDTIFREFSLPSWISPRYDVQITKFQSGTDGLPCYQTLLKISGKYNAPKTQMYFFETEKNLINRKVVYYIQTTRYPFKKANCVIVQGKIDLINQFMVIKIHDIEDFFKNNFERPNEELFDFSFQGNKINQLIYPYIQPTNISNIQFNEEHYLILFRGSGARSTTFVGAYKAMLDTHPQFSKKMKGVVASSNGCLISLAMITGQSPDFINQLFGQLALVGERDRMVNNQRDVIKRQLHYQEIQLKIKEVLYDYGILQAQIFDLLYQTIWSNPLVISKLLAAIAGPNITLQQAMTMESSQIEYIPTMHSEISSATNLIPMLTNRSSLLNFYGLLDGYLLKGQYIIQLASKVLIRFLLRKLKEDPFTVGAVLKINPVLINESNLKQISMKLTMRQFFELSGIQYTVISVDTDSQILRYLNKKTTPNLPVVNAIQISFAMPFFAKLPKWKRSWGKYYVHYRSRRKQIDLTGHMFMDGSLLDSSPILYFSNERLRRIFFTIKPNDFSKIMCFGSSYMQQQLPKNFSREQRFIELFQVLKQIAPLQRIYNLSKCPPKPTFYPFESLSKPTDIPIIGLFTRIQKTLKNSSDNIIKQTFFNQSFLFPENCQFSDFLVTGKTPYDIDQKYRSYHALRDSVHQLKDALFAINMNRENILKVLQQIIQKLDQPAYQQDHQYILRIKSNVLQEISAHALYAQEQKKRYKLAKMKGGVVVPEFENFIDKLETMMVDVLDDVRQIYKFGIFYRQRFMVQDSKYLQQTIRKIIQIYTIDKTAPMNLRLHLKMYIQNFFMVRKLQQYNQLNSLASFLDRHLVNMQAGYFNTYDPQFYKLNETFKKFRFEALPEFLQFSLRLQQLNETLMIQDRAFQKTRQHTKFYIDNILKRRTNNNIHIVFQSMGFHSKYLVEVYKLVNQVTVFDHYQATDQLYQELARMVIHQNQQIQMKNRIGFYNSNFTVEDLVKFIVVRSDLNQYLRKLMINLERMVIPRVIDLGYIKYNISEDLQLKLIKVYAEHHQNMCSVKAITTSGFSSFFAFLIAAGVDQQTLESQLWSFKQNFQINQQSIFEEYQTMDWCLKQEMMIRDLQDVLWNNRYDVWANMQQAAKHYRIKLDIDRIKSQFQQSREPILKSFTNVMNHIVASAKQSSRQANPTEYFNRTNSLRVYQDYYKINKQLSIQTKGAISMIMSMFEEQIRVIIMHLSLPKIQQVIELQDDPLKREAMWRGVIITHFIKSDKYKRHIYHTLRKINLPPEIKLRQFHQVIPTKIDITVNAIDFTQGKYVFINRYTYPEMPIWAALIIGASYPLIFSEVKLNRSWMYHISLENTQLARRNFFNQIPENQRKAPLFGSGSLVDSFPLSLVTNPKVIESSFNNNSYTYLNFGLRTAPPRVHKMIGFYCRRFLDNYELRQLFSGPSKIPYINQMSQIIMKHSNIMNSYVTSHDKLMEELYNANVIRLPSRVDVLEYHRLVPNDIINWQTQQQAYFCTYQKFVPNMRICFFQVKYSQYTTTLYFISKDKYRNDIFSDYNVYYKFRLQDEYQMVPLLYFITFNLTQYQIVFIKFAFIKSKDLVIKQGEYIIDLTTLKNFVKFDAIYQISYTQIFNRLIPPTKVNTKIFKPPSREVFADQIIVRSKIDVKKHGLFCQICCGSLALNQLLFFQEFGRHKCLCCQKTRPTKFVCQTKNCRGAYCLNCLKDELFIKHVLTTTCNLGHQLVFKGAKKSKQPKQFIRCQCCFLPTSFYYQDTVCGIRICNQCSTEVNVDAEAPSQ